MAPPDYGPTSRILIYLYKPLPNQQNSAAIPCEQLPWLAIVMLNIPTVDLPGHMRRAPYATPGRHGRQAKAPTRGSDGGDVAVHVRSSPDGSDSILVERNGTDKFWVISPRQDMLIDCRGGNGGHGGIGEDGQPGGEGEHGTDATQFTWATDGKQGYRGGDAGLGTDGAAGGNGGHVYMTVQETDMDTLLALRWDVTGGVGGESGRHGVPGEGGWGGQGGAGFDWYEEHCDTHTDEKGETHTRQHRTHHSHPAGSSGRKGYSGREITHSLSAGRSGANGYCRIKLLRNDGGEEMYSGRYRLVVHSFDVVDENEDGITEPGEYLIVKNIVVRNVGDMPSPRYIPLHVHIRPTPWLEPDMTQLVELPLDIPPGATMRVPGCIRALVRKESSQRRAGKLFRAEDTVSLVAFSKRLKRRVPEFSGSKQVVYQYPVSMSRPKFLDAVTIGDRVKFSWTVRNISSKPYGRTATPCRQLRSCISDLDGGFELVSANGQSASSRSVAHSVDEIKPGGLIRVSQYLTVSSTAAPFGVGQLRVKLFLSDPHDEDPSHARTVVHFDLSIQVSPSYRYNPRANFLIAINCAVPQHTILQLTDFIEQGLHLQADVFNLSLVGSFTTPNNRDVSLFSRYTGKTIIIFANEIVYFQNGTRDPWDLIDPWEVCRLATAGTSFLFVYPRDSVHFQKWARQLTLPAHPFPPPEEGTLVNKPKKVLAQLMNGPGSGEASPRLDVKKRIFRSLDSTALSEAESLKRRLDSQIPLRRFLISPVDDPSDPNRRAVVALSEGLAHQAQVVALLRPRDITAAAADGLLNAMVVHALPHADQYRIFWNVVCAGQTASLSPQSAYWGDSLRHLLDTDSNPEKKGEDTRIVDPKALETISWSISQKIASEISTFCRKVPWHDRSTNTIISLSQLPLLQTFLETAPPTLTHPISDEAIRLLNTIFPPAIALSAPLSTSQWLSQNVPRLLGSGPGNRKRKLRKLLRRELDQLLSSLYGPHSDAKKKAAETTRKLSKAVKQSLVQIKQDNPEFGVVDRAHEFACRRLAEITLVPRDSRVFVNLGDLSGVERSVTMTAIELLEQRRLYEEHLEKMKRDRALTEQMLADMVSHPETGPGESLNETETKSLRERG
ncbi:hypothetical protein V8F20_002708 [Naviculisporaceae sp. PSN 640]